ncbi:hypothetical protein BAR24_15115 [Gluconobacter oxydans]|uniref:fasciclin domain-containing protein n=1 Tax=Gluconobacter thailandicus TaxID=257438 RepID=UPI0002998251|nr:fasciclin domain-containing protein [Gluconobacter thailandicus]AFW01730.1 hypothetical protein B932_2163 [Gluconobacter oxydans H24]ANQ42656.1 hypothetical protein BAR24_15115 [Gluconobacter oxydans]
MQVRFGFPSILSGKSRASGLKLGGSLLLGLALAGCHGTDWSHNYQDSFETPAKTSMSYMPDAVAKAFVEPKNNEPSTPVAYQRPATPSYDDRPLDENIGASIELANYMAALRAVGLVPWITGPGPITVFAIPNEAMEKLSSRWPGGLMAPAMRGQLTHILGYTIVSGHWDEKTIRKTIARRHGQGIGLKTLYGDILSVHVEPQTGAILLNNPAGQTTRLWGHSFPQSNGVLYFTQDALIPVSR